MACACRQLSDIAAPWGGRVLQFDELPSTNTWALDHAGEIRHGDVVWALRQTAGRGRLGRTWVAPAGKCLTFSLVLAGERLSPVAPNLGQIAACAVRDALESLGVDCRLKWPNDIMTGDRKIAGLLVEQDSSRPFFVLGIGLNVNMTPGELQDERIGRPATSMLQVAGHAFDAGAVLGALLVNLAASIEELERSGCASLWRRWAQHDWLTGHRITVSGPEQQFEGEYRGVDEAGRLRIRTSSGEDRAFWTGEVERVKTVKAGGRNSGGMMQP